MLNAGFFLPLLHVLFFPLRLACRQGPHDPDEISSVSDHCTGSSLQGLTAETLPSCSIQLMSTTA